MAYNPLNPNGQAAMANSQPVVIASNQTPVSVTGTVILGPTSVATLQGTNPWVVQLTSGSVITTGGNSSVQVVGQMPPQSVSGVGTFSIDPVGSGSIIAKLTNSSVTALQGTNPWFVQLTSGSVITTGGNSSVQVVGQIPPTSVSGVGLFNVNPTGNGSVITTFSNSPSIVGTYAEDSGHVTADKGIFMLGVRNDTMSSITSADLDYTPWTTGPVGEGITANSPITKWISGQTSVMYGTSVQAIAPQGDSVFTYITGLQLANPSANASLVKITGGLGSVLGWTIAPANGGSNIVFPNALKTGENSGISASISGVSSVYVTLEGFIAKI